MPATTRNPFEKIFYIWRYGPFNEYSAENTPHPPIPPTVYVDRSGNQYTDRAGNPYIKRT